MDSPWQYFEIEELRCRCGCGRCSMNADFMARIVGLRRAVGFPFIVTSAFRCEAYDRNIAPGIFAPRPHVLGKAMDINVYQGRALTLVRAALDHGFTGIGLAQKGELRSRFVHLDTCTAADGLRPTIWTY
jgi:uncharacterized protein YcbK (DUF882 family)